MACPLRVLCLGNLLHGNDGLGNALFLALDKRELPEQVELVDGGIGGMTLLPWFRDCSRILVIDVCIGCGESGSLLFFPHIEHDNPIQPSLSGEHGGDLSTLMAMLPLYLKSLPQVDLFCLAVESMEFFHQPDSNFVEDGVKRLVNRIEDYIDNAFYGERVGA